MTRGAASSWIAATALACLSVVGAHGCRASFQNELFDPQDELFDPDFAPAVLEQDQAGPPAPAVHERGWFAARRTDLLRMVQVRVAVGPGLGARAAATKLVQAGFLLRGPAGPAGETLTVPTLVVGDSGGLLGAWDVRSVEYGLSRFYVYEEDVLDARGRGRPWRSGVDERPFWALEAGAHLALVGAEVTFDPGAAARLLAGLVGFGEGGWW